MPDIILCIFIYVFNRDAYPIGDLILLAIALWLFGMGMMSVTMFIQNLFSDPRLATMVMPFIFFIPTGIAMTLVLAPILTSEANTYIQYLFWFPNFPFTVVMVNLLDKSPLEYFTVENGVAWFFLVIQTPLWYLLHLYIEAVKPDMYGVSRSLCFCFKSCRKTSNLSASNEHEMDDLSTMAPIKGDKIGDIESRG